MPKDNRDVLEGEMREVNEGGVELFDASDSSEKAMTTLRDIWWPQRSKQDGDRICKRVLGNVSKKRNEGRNVGGDSWVLGITSFATINQSNNPSV